MIAGAPAWLKPAKFAASIAIYSLTLAWVTSHVRGSPVVRWAGDAIAALFAAEWVIIAVQAARGAASHFNVGTPLDAVLFRMMGIAIAMVWIASLVILVVLCRAKVSDALMGHAARLGLAVTLIGAALGAAMLGATRVQRAATLASGRPTLVALGVWLIASMLAMAGVYASRPHAVSRYADSGGLHA